MISRILVLIALLSSSVLWAQSELDVLRFSRTMVNGSARFNAMGGSMGALGGDLSLSGTNPAGISAMNYSQVIFSPYIRSSNVRGTHYGEEQEMSRWNLRMGNLGLNIRLKEDDNEWKNVYLTYSYNNRQDYGRTTRLEALNPESSQVDVFFNQLLYNQGTDLRGIDSLYPFDISLAWNTFLIDTFNNFFFTAVPNYGQNQIYQYSESGRVGESNFAISGLFRDRLYLGASFALSSARYELTSTLREEIPEADTNTFLNNYEYEQNLVMSGEAINFKAGMIYKWNDWLRTGLAIHSPDFYSFTDSWNAAIVAEYESVTLDAESFDGLYDYRIQTPWRYIASVAYTYKKDFLFNMDYEFVDYASGRLNVESGLNNPFSYENDWLKNNALNGHNFRFGAEYNYQSLGFRAGFAYYSKAANTAFNSDTRIYSIGVGNTLEIFYWDIGFSYCQHGQEYFWIYDPSFATIENSTRRISSLATSLTVGLRF